jgi:hypothetical protein
VGTQSVRHGILIRSKVLESKGSCFRLDGTHELNEGEDEMWNTYKFPRINSILPFTLCSTASGDKTFTLSYPVTLVPYPLHFMAASTTQCLSSIR